MFNILNHRNREPGTGPDTESEQSLTLPGVDGSTETQTQSLTMDISQSVPESVEYSISTSANEYGETLLVLTMTMKTETGISGIKYYC